MLETVKGTSFYFKNIWYYWNFSLFYSSPVDKEQGNTFFILSFNQTSKNCCLWSTSPTSSPILVSNPEWKNIPCLQLDHFLLGLPWCSCQQIKWSIRQIPCRWFPQIYDTNSHCILKLIHQALITATTAENNEQEEPL